jgi:hypothetical protein
MDAEQKIQQLELETVKAVTEMKGDIKNLTNEIKKLNDTVSRMTDNYVTKTEYEKDQQDLDNKIEEVKKSGNIKALLFSITSAVVTAVVVFEVMRFLRSGE